MLNVSLGLEKNVINVVNILNLNVYNELCNLNIFAQNLSCVFYFEFY